MCWWRQQTNFELCHTENSAFQGLLGPKKELWDILQLVEKYTSEAQDITTSVRDLPTVRTHMGRARAWLRLALMQKKLADYLKVLIDRKDDVLYEYFEPDALMMSDEALIITGLLIGLNVIDCNLCVKVSQNSAKPRQLGHFRKSVNFSTGRRLGLPARCNRLLSLPSVQSSLLPIIGNNFVSW